MIQLPSLDNPVDNFISVRSTVEAGSLFSLKCVSTVVFCTTPGNSSIMGTIFKVIFALVFAESIDGIGHLSSEFTFDPIYDFKMNTKDFIKYNSNFTVASHLLVEPNTLSINVCNGTCTCFNYEDECVSTSRADVLFVVLKLKDAVNRDGKTNEVILSFSNPSKCACRVPQHIDTSQSYDATVLEISMTGINHLQPAFDGPNSPEPSEASKSLEASEPSEASKPRGTSDPWHLDMASVISGFMMAIVLLFLLWCSGCLKYLVKVVELPVREVPAFLYDSALQTLPRPSDISTSPTPSDESGSSVQTV